MYFANTEIHMVTFVFAVLETAILPLLIFNHWCRPGDKKRLRYVWLLMLLIAYNIFGGSLPDPDIAIPVKLQTVAAYAFAIALTMSFAHHVYKTLDLSHLKFFATDGVLIFVFAPFVILFVIPYFITNDLAVCRRMFVFMPFFYSVGFIYQVTEGLILKQRAGKLSQEPNSNTEAVSVYFALLCFASLPVILFFGDMQVLEHSVINSGFFVMATGYLWSLRQEANKDHFELQQTKKSFHELKIQLKETTDARIKELEKMNADLKEGFIGWSHDAKTPLVLIGSYVDEYIHRHGNSEELQIVKTNVNKLTSDIVNFFDVERFSKGVHLYNHNQVIDLSVLLKSCLELFRPLAARKSITLKAQIEDHALISAHPEAMERVIRNILENAVKYTPEGGYINVELSFAEDKINVSIADTGTGIPGDMHHQVFEPFVRLNPSDANVQGAGMGLSIVKKIVEGLEGQILLKSDESSGTEITLVLNRYIGDISDIGYNYQISEDLTLYIADRPLRDEITDPNWPYVLLVEDNIPMLAFLLCKLRQQYNVYIAKNGLEAIQKLKEIDRLDIIISDVVMPVMDGLKFYEELANLKVYEHIPFVFLSAKNTNHDKLSGMRMGAIDYIGKPFYLGQLNQKIESLLIALDKQRKAIIEKFTRNMTSVGTNQTAFEMNCQKYGLTKAEIKVYMLASEGVLNKQIADQLNCSERTIGTHITNMLRKTNSTNRIELIRKLEGNLKIKKLEE